MSFSACCPTCGHVRESLQLRPSPAPSPDGLRGPSTPPPSGPTSSPRADVPVPLSPSPTSSCRPTLQSCSHLLFQHPTTATGGIYQRAVPIPATATRRIHNSPTAPSAPGTAAVLRAGRHHSPACAGIEARAAHVPASPSR